MSSPRQSTTDMHPPTESTAPTWMLLIVVLAAIGAIGYFAFYETGRNADKGKAPTVIALTSPVPVPVATPTPAPAPSASTP